MKNSRELALPLCIVAFLAMVAVYWPFKVDDAYISFVYARNLAEGNGLTYNGMVVEGYSNFLWTLLLTPFIGLGLDPLLSGRLLSVASACGCLAVTNKLLKVFHPGLAAPVRLLALLTVAVSAPFVAWTVGGLETIFFAFLVTLFILLEIQPARGSKVLALIVGLAAALTRPEGIVLLPVMVLFRRFGQKQTWRQVLSAAALYSAMFAGYLAWRYWTYGYFFANTAFLKLHANVPTTLSAGVWLLSFLLLRPLFAILLAVAVVRLLKARHHGDIRLSPILLTVGAFVIFILYAGADWMPHHRFVAPIFPLLSVLAAYGLNDLTRSSVRVTMVTIGGAVVAMEIFLALTLYRPLSREFGQYTEGLVAGGQWIRANTTPAEHIAVVDAGALAYYSQRPTVDILGLNDEHIAHSPNKGDADYVLSHRPQIIQLHVDFTTDGSIVEPSGNDHRLDVFRHPEFELYYRPYTAGPDDPFFPKFFIRQDAADAASND